MGYDKFSYALRDVGGEKCHKSLREDYAREALAEGDVIGVLIHLPAGPPEKPMVRPSPSRPLTPPPYRGTLSMSTFPGCGLSAAARSFNHARSNAPALARAP